MSNWLDRLITEEIELNKKIKKLEAFLDTEEFNKLKRIEQFLISAQRDEMLAYANVLKMRLELY